jgi:nitrile hydratase beta subunit
VNGVHDLGGMHGFGPVLAEPEDREPVYHAEWEPVVQATMQGTLSLRQWSLDEFRRNIEQLAPADYLTFSYYEKWLASLERLVVEHGLVTAEELAGIAEPSATAPPEPAWHPTFDPPPSEPAFKTGQVVRVRNRHPSAHTRAPRYIRGHRGTVLAHVGGEPLPEDASAGVCTVEHIYRVRFEATELWGPDAAGNDPVHLELWESYLEPLG